MVGIFKRSQNEEILDLDDADMIYFVEFEHGEYSRALRMANIAYEKGDYDLARKSAEYAMALDVFFKSGYGNSLNKERELVPGNDFLNLERIFAERYTTTRNRPKTLQGILNGIYASTNLPELRTMQRFVKEYISNRGTRDNYVSKPAIHVALVLEQRIDFLEKKDSYLKERPVYITNVLEGRLNEEQKRRLFSLAKHFNDESIINILSSERYQPLEKSA